MQVGSVLASVSSAIFDDSDTDDRRSVESVMLNETKEIGTLDSRVINFYWRAMTGPIGMAVLTSIVLMQTSRDDL